MSDLRVNRVRSLSGGTVEFVDGVSGNATGLRFAPKIIQYSPLALATDVNPTTSQFQFTFDQPIKFHGTGTIQIIKSSDSSVYESFAITDGGTAGVGVTIAANVLQLTTSAGNFEFFTSYHVAFSSAGIANTYNDYLVANDGYTFRTSSTTFDIQGGDYEFVAASTLPAAQGGSPTGYYKYHIFSNPGIATATAPSSTATDLRVLMIGGGGAGGSGVRWPTNTFGSGDQAGATGGGGAGGYLTFTGPSLNFGSGDWNVTVGAGGSAARYLATQNDIIPFAQRNGTNSVLSTPTLTHTAYGGGYGGNWSPQNNPTTELTDAGFPDQSDWDWGSPGGSGGGGGGFGHTVPDWAPGGSKVPGQGNDGNREINIKYDPSGTSRGPAEPYNLGGGGGGAGGAGGEGLGYTQTNPSRANYYGRHGEGGVGIANTFFPSSVLAPQLTDINPLVWTRMGPTGDMYGGGGAGGGAHPPGTAPFNGISNVGGFGGGGRSASPWKDGTTPTDSNTPIIPQPAWTQDGAQLLGGGGGGGIAHYAQPEANTPNLAERGGQGGPGSIMIRYVHPGS